MTAAIQAENPSAHAPQPQLLPQYIEKELPLSKVCPLCISQGHNRQTLLSTVWTKIKRTLHSQQHADIQPTLRATIQAHWDAVSRQKSSP